MKLYKITTQRFTGEIEVVYDERLTLVKIDFTNTNIEMPVVDSFKRAIPASLPIFLQGKWCGSDVNIIEADYEIVFADFWAAYNKKINKIRAIKIFNGLGKLDKALALQGVKKYDTYLRSNDWRKKADPENYLRSRMWENEY